MAMNYDNDMNPRTRRKLPRMNTLPGAGYTRRMPMPMNPPSMGSGSDVLRNFANRRGKLGSVVERPMLSTGAMTQLPPLGFMPTNPGMGSGLRDVLGLEGMPPTYGTMDLNSDAPVAAPQYGRRRGRAQVSNMVPETQSNPQWNRRASELMAALNLMSGQGNF